MQVPHDPTHHSDNLGLQHPAEQADNPAPGARTTLALISDARAALAEARTLPDIRKVMEAAAIAADAGRRAAKLAKAHDLATDVVRDAEAAANDAAAVRIEAQAKAGELLHEMAERGERARPGDADGRRQRPSVSLGDLGVTKSESSRWQQVAGVPPAVRTEYVEETTAASGEVSTDGLMRHAERAAVDRFTAELAPPDTHRYRLALARTAEQASRIAQFDAGEAARLVDQNSAIVLESAARTWDSWVARFLRARGQLHVIDGGN
jgi:hypothetical protein